MYIVCECLDNPEASEARAATLDAHRTYLKSAEILRLGGPMQDENGNGIGSILVVEVDSIDAAKAFVAGDPFAAAGVFAQVNYKAFKPTINSFA